MGEKGEKPVEPILEEFKELVGIDCASGKERICLLYTSDAADEL